MKTDSKEMDLRRLVAFVDFGTGLYSRVARKLGISPSYVSRVARRERRAAPVEDALLEEWGSWKPKMLSDAAKLTREGIVFVLDDEPAIAETWKRILAGAGYDSRSFCDPLSALDAIRQSPPPVLVCDVALPGISGIDLAIMLREEKIPTTVILASGHATTASYLETAAQKGYLFDVLPKPIGPITLRQRVHEVMQQYVPPSSLTSDSKGLPRV